MFAEMFRSIFGMKRAGKVLCVLNILEFRASQGEEQITSVGLLDLSGHKSPLPVCGVELDQVRCLKTEVHETDG